VPVRVRPAAIPVKRGARGGAEAAVEAEVEIEIDAEAAATGGKAAIEDARSRKAVKKSSKPRSRRR
jgi:hypothetical protein